jgi:hypothetical protein
VPITDAIAAAEHYDEEEMALGYYATGLHVSVTILQIAGTYKARYLRHCHLTFVIGLIFIVGAVLISGIKFMVFSPSQTQPDQVVAWALALLG